MQVEQLEARALLAFTGLPLQIGGSRSDFGQAIAVTPDGGFVATGLFAGTVDFYPSAGVSALTSLADTDIYVAKYSSAGALEWVRQLGGSAKKDRINDQDRRIDIAANPQRVGEQFLHGVGSDPKNAGEYVKDVVVGSDGSITIVGEFIGSVNFNIAGGARTFKTFDNEYYDAFVARYDSNGQMTWARQIGDRFTETANAVALDPSGNVLVTGLFARSVKFAPGNPAFNLNARGRADGYVMKLNAAGAVQWVSQFGGDAINQPIRDQGNDVTTDAAGNVYVAGSFGGSADFDPSKTGVFSLRSKDQTDGVLLKLSSAGRFRSALQFGGPSYDALTQVQVDSSFNIFVGGYFQGERFDADPGPATLTLRATPSEQGDDPRFLDAFVAKLSRNGVAWTQQIAGTKTEFITAMSLDQNEDLVLAGAFYGRATFGTGPQITSVRGPDEFRDENDNDRHDSYDAYLWKIQNGNGTTVFANTLGAEQDDFGVGIAIAPDNQILLSGRFRSVVDFDPSSGQRLLTAGGLADAFIAGFDENGASLLA